MRRLLPLLLLLGLASLPAWAALSPESVAIIVNQDDPDSFKLGEYYAARRGIPAENIVQVSLGVPRAVLDPEVFDRAYIKTRIATRHGIQAYALAFTTPYRVGCMSITTAFALGYGKRFCADGCNPTAPNPMYDADSGRPWEDFGLHPTMMLAAKDLPAARQLVDRGVNSDGRQPAGRAYLVITEDSARNSRAAGFSLAKARLGGRYAISIERTAGIRDRQDVMFYFTGAMHVPDLNTLHFLPGAIGDHLTSFGGQLDGRSQMSALRWLEAGAVASYGTVVEPCNFPQKFPDPGILMRAYLNGDTAIEAYWKSVVWPGQGLFIGEPLARPFGPARKD